MHVSPSHKFPPLISEVDVYLYVTGVTGAVVAVAAGSSVGASDGSAVGASDGSAEGSMVGATVASGAYVG